MPSRMLDAADALRFILAGNATVTLRNAATESRFTYKIQVPQDPDPTRPVYFVKLLNGPDNTADYQYLGAIFGRSFRLTQKSRIGPDAPSYILFRFVFEGLVRGDLNSSYEVWHEDRCGRCGRVLTVPESIATGIGPDCAALMGIPMATLPGPDARSSERGPDVPSEYPGPTRTREAQARQDAPPIPPIPAPAPARTPRTPTEREALAMLLSCFNRIDGTLRVFPGAAQFEPVDDAREAQSILDAAYRCFEDAR